MNFDYYYGDESNQFAFYRIPRQLITGEAFKKLSTDAKLLYGLLLDRMGLSAKNGWYDDMGRVFIYYTLDEIQEDLNCGHEKAVRLLAELDTGKKGFGLIERVKQGQGRPTKIYVKRFTTRTIPPQPPAPQDIPRLPIFGSQDFGKAEVKSSEKQKSRLPVIGSADFRKSDTSYIESIKVFDLIDTDRSDAFNPFPYLKDDKDAMKLVNNLIKNTTPKNSTNNDPFWEKSEIALDTALILYLLHEAPPEEQNLEMVMYMIENGGAREDDDDFQSPLDMLFEALEEEEPDHVAVREYKIFKQAAGKTAKSILLSAAVRLSAFILPQITRITSRDDMELGLMGERKQAVFAIIPDNDGTFNYLVGMLYTCAFQALYYQADKVHQGALPVPVRLMMDEFCNVSLPDDFGKLQATMRSRNIMSTIVLQNISALKALFKDDWEGLLGNADTLVYLGGNEPSTHKYISELLGKETLDTRNRSVSRGSHGSSSVSYQQTGRELMTPDEVRTLDNDYALLFIRGERPVMDKKYDILKHPYIKLTEDGGAAPYVHHPGLTYAQADLSVPFESLDYIEILE